MAAGPIDATEVRAAQHGLDRFDDRLGRVAGRSVDVIAADALVNVRRRRARHRVTGRGERMIELRAHGTGTARTATVEAHGYVAAILAGGSRGHVIRARNARALYLGARGFAASVRHPGTRADPFVAKGLADTRAAIERQTRGAADALAAELADELEG